MNLLNFYNLLHTSSFFALIVINNKQITLDIRVLLLYKVKTVAYSKTLNLDVIAEISMHITEMCHVLK